MDIAIGNTRSSYDEFGLEQQALFRTFVSEWLDRVAAYTARRRSAGR